MLLQSSLWLHKNQRMETIVNSCTVTRAITLMVKPTRVTTAKIFRVSKKLKMEAKVLIIVLIFCLTQETFGKIVVNSDRDLVIPEYISFLIRAVADKDPSRNHDVVLLRLEHNKKNEIYDNILSEILKKNPENCVFAHEKLEMIEAYRVNAASLFIIVSDVENSVSINSKISHKSLNYLNSISQNDLFIKFTTVFFLNYWSNSAKFIFVPTDFKFHKLGSIFKFFYDLGVTNAVALHREQTLKVFTFNQFRRTIYEIGNGLDNIDIIFENKLQNLNGYTYKTLIIDQPPRLYYSDNNNSFKGVDLKIFQALVEKQNAYIKLVAFLIPHDPKLDEKVEYLIAKRAFDLTLNTMAVGRAKYIRFINTYDENGYCAIIPIPPRLSFLRFLLTPYDVSSWILLVLSVTFCAIVWRVSKQSPSRSDSTCRFVFGIIANFLGNSIPFGNNRRMQVVILQLCILMTFIMGNAYQSLLISSMSSSRDGIRFKTFEEMFNSDLKFKVDGIFRRILVNSGEFPSVTARMEIASSGNGSLDFKKWAESNYASIARCDNIEHQMNYETWLRLDENYYLLPDKMTKFYEKFWLGQLSPFYENLQRNFDYAFESGIRQYWKKYLEPKKLAELNREASYIENEEYLLKMIDVYGIFYILIVGYVISIFALLAEIMWHDCFTEYFKKLIFRSKKIKKRKMFVRRTQVRPFDV